MYVKTTLFMVCYQVLYNAYYSKAKVNANTLSLATHGIQ